MDPKKNGTYSFDVQYRRDKLNVVADALSRQPVESCQSVLEKSQECAWWKKRCEEVVEFPEKFPDYTIINGQLYRHIPTRDEDEECAPWKLCVPVFQRKRVLEENHDSPAAGHLGIRKTAARISNRYHWPGMFREIKEYVRRCQTCQAYKPNQQLPAGQLVRRNLHKAAKDQARYFNLRRRRWKPKVGELVLVKEHHLSNAADNFAAKLAPKFEGPYTVHRFVSPVIVELRQEGRTKIRTAHVSELKCYRGTVEPESGDSEV